ncbi:serpin B11-like [Drosophila albomicans]|uniref:Serpin B11-like n=1 Tax=Drosophila albomicans TaxID=7291 RepID=A0A6P8XE56_DROAB|nr:serpin B11-like [Drosophila albomicans]
MAKVSCKLAVSLLLIVCGIQSSIAEKLTSSIVATVLRQSDKNVIFSPWLLTESLMHLHLAAGGKTAHEINKVLQLNGKLKSEIFANFSNYQESINISESQTLHMANRLFLASEINLSSKYLQQEKEIFPHSSQSVDFAKSSETIRIINNWIAEESNGTITKLVEQLDAKTKALSLSAIYFKGLWKYAFNRNNTKKSIFYIPQKTGEPRQIEVDMMFRRGLYRLDMIDKLDAMSLEIPYDSSQLSMVILLPKTVNGINKIISNLNQMDIDEISPKTNEMYVQVYLPKFHLDVELSLNEALKSLGLVEIFQNANFSAMTDSKVDLKVDKIFQKSIIEVDEEGSANVAPQDLGFSFLRFPIEIVIRIDHPFVFLIKDHDKIYLAGRVTME